MFQVGVVVGNPAPLLTNVTDIVAGNSASMHQKFKTFSRPPVTPNTQQNRGKFSTLARVEKIPATTNSKEVLEAETDQGKSHLKDKSYFREQNNVLCKCKVRPIFTREKKSTKVGKCQISFSSF